MNVKGKRNGERSPTTSLTLAQLAVEVDVPETTLRLWLRDLPPASFSSPAPSSSSRSSQSRSSEAQRFVVADIAIVRALKRFMALEGATLDDARWILAAAGPGALIAAFGAAPDGSQFESPARRLQDAVRKAAAAGLFGEVVAEIAQPAEDRRPPSVASLGQARLTRYRKARDLAETKTG